MEDMSKGYKDTTPVFIRTDKDTIPYDETSRALNPYYKRRAERGFEELEKTANIVLKFLKEHDAPKEVLEAFEQSRRRTVWMI